MQFHRTRIRHSACRRIQYRGAYRHRHLPRRYFTAQVRQVQNKHLTPLTHSVFYGTIFSSQRRERLTAFRVFFCLTEVYRMQNTQNTVRRIHSIQPYLVLKTDSFCQHLLSSYGISHFYSFSTGCGADTAVSLVPDGCSNILFAYGKDSMTADVYGSTVDKQEITFSPCTDYFGIRFFAGENPCFENFPVKELDNSSTSLRDFPDMAHMFTRMSGEETFNGRMSTFLDE